MSENMPKSELFQEDRKYFKQMTISVTIKSETE